MMNLSILNLETGEMLGLSKVGSFPLRSHALFQGVEYADDSMFTLMNLSRYLGNAGASVDQDASDELFALLSFLIASIGQPIVLINDYTRDATLHEIMVDLGIDPETVEISGPYGGHARTKRFVDRRKNRLLWTNNSRDWFESLNLSPLARDAIRRLFKRKLVDEERLNLHEVSPSDYRIASDELNENND